MITLNQYCKLRTENTAVHVWIISKKEKFLILLNKFSKYCRYESLLSKLVAIPIGDK
jgi:hypothetical protein